MTGDRERRNDSTSLHDRLYSFVAGKTRDLGREPDGGLTEHASLIRSGLFDSLALAELFAWIEAESGGELDLTEVDTLDQWDTMARILEFVEEQRRPANAGEPK